MFTDICNNYSTLSDANFLSFTGSILQIQCTNPTCLLKKNVPTGSKHKLKPGMKQCAWDVKTKLAAGI